MQIYPMTGTLTHLLTKAKLQQSLDGIFVSSRAAQILGEVRTVHSVLHLFFQLAIKKVTDVCIDNIQTFLFNC